MMRRALIPPTPSRRGFLAVLSAGAATLASPAAVARGAPETGLAAPVACPPADADAKLCDLARQLAVVAEQGQRLCAGAWEASKIADAEVIRRLGFDPHATTTTKKQQKLAWKTWCAVREELGTDAVVEKCEPVDARMDAIHAEMMALPIKTLRGAAIMCSAAIVTGVISDWWDEPLKDLDWDKEVIRRLVENITATAGISGMP
jgi:hypothetical protein